MVTLLAVVDSTEIFTSDIMNTFNLTKTISLLQIRYTSRATSELKLQATVTLKIMYMISVRKSTLISIGNSKI